MKEASTQSQVEALNHPTRREILRQMDGEPASPAQLSKTLEDSVSNVSYHFRVLVESGVLKLVRTRPARGSVEHFYEIEPLSDWAKDLLATSE